MFARSRSCDRKTRSKTGLFTNFSTHLNQTLKTDLVLYHLRVALYSKSFKKKANSGHQYASQNSRIARSAARHVLRRQGPCDHLQAPLSENKLRC